MMLVKLLFLVLSLNQPNATRQQQQSFLQRYHLVDDNLSNRLPHRSYTNSIFPFNIVVGLPSNAGSTLRNPFGLSIAKAQPVFDVACEVRNGQDFVDFTLF
jgi:hypothetical protein